MLLSTTVIIIKVLQLSDDFCYFFYKIFIFWFRDGHFFTHNRFYVHLVALKSSY